MTESLWVQKAWLFGGIGVSIGLAILVTVWWQIRSRSKALPSKGSGDVIQGNVGSHARNVAVGKGIIQIGSLIIPNHLALLFVGGVVMIMAATIHIAVNTSAIFGAITAPPTATPIPTPTPLPLSPASADEQLIVIFTFRVTEGNRDTAIHDEIRQAIVITADQLEFSHLRVEIEPTSLSADARSEAEALGNQYGASMVIWGADTGVRVTANYLNLKQPDFTAAFVPITQTDWTQVVNPDAYARFVTSGLPSQLTFLSLFAIGQSYYVNADYEHALSTMERAISSLTSDVRQVDGLADAHFRLGWLYAHNHKLEQAAVEYSKAIELNPQKPDAYHNRGGIYYTQSKYGEAIADLTTAIELEPGNFDFYYARGASYRARGERELAIADFNTALTGYTQAIERDPQSASAYTQRGDVYWLLGEQQRAIDDFSQAIAIQPDDADAYNSRGNAYAALGEVDKAIADYTKALELSASAMVYNNLGLIYDDLGEYERAIAEYTKAIELEPGHFDSYNNRGLAYRRQGELEKAIADYTKAIALNPTFDFAYNNRGFAYRKQGEYEKALGDYIKATELAPNDPLYHYRACQLGSVIGKAADVLDTCDTAVALATEDTRDECLDARGVARALAGDRQGAVEDFTEIAEWSKANGQYEPYGHTRELWATALNAGGNPFDEKTLEELSTLLDEF